jgi:hypothetical protein
MIKISEKNKTESYWHNEELYDAKREKEYKVKFLGITIYTRTESRDCDWGEVNGKSFGFNKK